MDETTTTPDAPAFTLHCRATAEEVYHQALLGRGKGSPWLAVASKILVPLFVSGVVVMVIELPYTGSTDLTLGLIGLFVAIWSASGFVMLYSPWRPAEAKRRWLGDETTMTIDGHGMSASSDWLSASFRWEAFSEIREDAHAIVFMRRRAAIAWLPGSAFESPTQREQVLEYARAQMAARGVDTATDKAVPGWPVS